MKQVRVKGLHRVPVKDRKGNWSEAVLAVKYRRLCILPPVAKQKQYPSLPLTVIWAQEQTVPEGRDRIDGKLTTNLPVKSRSDALQKISWYAMRWKIEMFHKVLKSGCQAEQARLRTADRLSNLISVFCLLSWRIFWLTMLNRVDPEVSPLLALTPLEIDLLDHLVKDLSELVPEEWCQDKLEEPSCFGSAVVTFEPGRPIVRYPVSYEIVPCFWLPARLGYNVVGVESSFGVRRRNGRIVSRIESF